MDYDDDESVGVPQWVVTYGDMMSLLLTFFIMLVSLSEIVNEERYRSILEALHRYIGYRTAPQGPPGDSFPLNSVIAQLQTLGSPTSQEMGHGGVRRPSVEETDLRVFHTREGNPLAVGDLISFAPDDATLSEKAQDELREIAAVLAGKPNKIEIRAHASLDPPPGDARFPDKHVLTYERGREVLKFLQAEGVAPQRMRVTVAADKEPLPQTGEQLFQQHDRVEVLMLDAFAEEFVGPRDIPD